jgi:hypothetical protein
MTTATGKRKGRRAVGGTAGRTAGGTGVTEKFTETEVPGGTASLAARAEDLLREALGDKDPATIKTRDEDLQAADSAITIADLEARGLIFPIHDFWPSAYCVHFTIWHGKVIDHVAAVANRMKGEGFGDQAVDLELQLAYTMFRVPDEANPERLRRPSEREVADRFDFKNQKLMPTLGEIITTGLLKAAETEEATETANLPEQGTEG